MLVALRTIQLVRLYAIALGTAEWLCVTRLVPLRAIAACVLRAIIIALLCRCAQITLPHLRYCAQSINHAFTFAKILINCVAKKEKENKVE